MKLPPNYYHCFLGNGLDAVLVGPTGSMTRDKFSVDRGAWYKADRYYPEDKLVMAAGRWPMDKPLEHAPGSGWYDVAPLGRTWYEVLEDGQPLALQSSQQRFVPHEGTLYSEVIYAATDGIADVTESAPSSATSDTREASVAARVTTFLHATRSVLIERYEFNQEVEFRAWLGPGVWVEEGWDTDPFYSVEMRDAPEGRYDLGETRGIMALRLEPAANDSGAPAGGRDRWLSTRGSAITKYFGISDDRQGPLDTAFLDEAVSLGYDALRAEQLAFWRDYFSTSSLRIPDEHAWAQEFYEASLYHFKAMQNRASGGLPVNNLRRTWSSHIFWDSYFLHRALLESNHLAEALEGCRFFQRTLDHARRHAREEFGSDGLKWDWEITHDGRKAYGALLHMKDQVHNNASYANEVWNYYEFTQDRKYLREFFPILEGLARYFLQDVVQKTERGYETRPVVGVHESPIRVKNDGITVTGAIVILRRAAEAARLLGLESDPPAQECAAVAEGLTHVLDRLYNGRFFKASEDSDAVNMSSIAPLYPMHVVDYADPRAVQTTQAYLARYEHRMIGHGGNQAGFPWAAGVLATVLAQQGDGNTAWAIIEGTRPAICSFGGMTEVMSEGHWNMQYFGTAQAAVCTAIHNLLLQARGDAIHLFPALPAGWREAQFERLLAAGMSVSAKFENGRAEGEVRNIAPAPLVREICFRDQRLTLTLQPGEAQAIKFV